MTTKIDRGELAAILNFTAPALSPHEFVPVLTHFCFTEQGWLEAYSGTLAIRTVTDVDFVGALPGQQLLKLVNSYKDKTLTLKEGTGEQDIVLQSGRSKLKLQMISEEDFVFQRPDEDDAEAVIEVDDSFLLAIKSCLAGVGDDQLRPEQLGITVEATGDSVGMYATDNLTISAYFLDSVAVSSGKIPSNLIIPTEFCTQLLNLAKYCPEDDIDLYIFDGGLLATVPDVAEVYSSLIGNPEPIHMGDMVNEYLDQADELFTEIPAELQDAMARAKVVVGNKDATASHFQIEGNTLTVLSTSQTANSQDEIELSDECDDITFAVDPKIVSRALGLADAVCFLDSAIVFTKGENFAHLVSHSGEVD